MASTERTESAEKRGGDLGPGVTVRYLRNEKRSRRRNRLGGQEKEEGLTGEKEV